jgi:outer membrane protein TolC
LGILGLAIGGCKFAEPPPFDPRQLEQIQKQEAADAPAPSLPALPTTYHSPIPPGWPNNRPLTMTTRPSAATTRPIGPNVLRLTLRELIHRAVMNNLDTRVAGYDAAVNELRILEAKAAFDPTLFSQYQWQKQVQQRGIASTLTPDPVRTQQAQVGVRQQLSSGAQVELKEQTTRTLRGGPTNPLDFPLNPYWENELSFQVTQPLLKDFGAKVNRARIIIARNDYRVSQLDWRDRLEEVLTQLEQSYWTLASRVREVEIQERLLNQTEATLEILLKRMTHDVGRLQVAQANADLETRNAELVQAQSEIGTLSDQIKRLLNDPDLPVAGAVVILPADAPVAEPIRLVLADQIETALQNRADLMQQKIRIASANEVRGAAKNNTYPQLNLIGNLGVKGPGADLDDAFNRQLDGDLFEYGIGVAFEVPIGNRQAKAIYQRTLLQQQQAVEEYRRLSEVAALEVKQAMRDLETSWNSMVATRYATFAAADALDAIEQRERAGEPLTPEFVRIKLDQQRQLAVAERAEAQAVAQYNIAISALERAKGTLLRYNDVIMKEEPGPAFQAK